MRFDVAAERLSVVDAHGTRHVLAGAHELIFSRGHGVELRKAVELQVRGGLGRIVVSTMAGWTNHPGV